MVATFFQLAPIEGYIKRYYAKSDKRNGTGEVNNDTPHTWPIQNAPSLASSWPVSNWTNPNSMILDLKKNLIKHKKHNVLIRATNESSAAISQIHNGCLTF
jgi:hypothetical protein